VLACNQVFDVVTSPKLAEALAIRHALSLVREEGFNKIILASDCLSVINKIQNPALDRTGTGVIIHDIKVIAGEFRSVTFRHISRLRNESAHLLARRAELLVFSVFCDGAPEFIHEAPCNDSG
jgi:ribonuclease HI